MRLVCFYDFHSTLTAAAAEAAFPLPLPFFRFAPKLFHMELIYAVERQRYQCFLSLFFPFG